MLQKRIGVLRISQATPLCGSDAWAENASEQLAHHIGAMGGTESLNYNLQTYPHTAHPIYFKNLLESGNDARGMAESLGAGGLVGVRRVLFPIRVRVRLAGHHRERQYARHCSLGLYYTPIPQKDVLYTRCMRLLMRYAKGLGVMLPHTHLGTVPAAPYS